jgi:hypothetical protein
MPVSELAEPRLLLHAQVVVFYMAEPSPRELCDTWCPQSYRAKHGSTILQTSEETRSTNSQFHRYELYLATSKAIPAHLLQVIEYPGMQPPAQKIPLKNEEMQPIEKPPAREKQKEMHNQQAEAMGHNLMGMNLRMRQGSGGGNGTNIGSSTRTTTETHTNTLERTLANADPMVLSSWGLISPTDNATRLLAARRPSAIDHIGGHFDSLVDEEYEPATSNDEDYEMS